MRALIFASVLLACLPTLGTSGSCSHLGDCNGHGTCDSVNSRCVCYNGWGSSTDVATYKAPDCSSRECRHMFLAKPLGSPDFFSRPTILRAPPHPQPHTRAGTCPSDRAWVDVPSGPHAAHAVAECSNAGLCDRTAGRCRCFAGYEGDACQRCACDFMSHARHRSR